MPTLTAAIRLDESATGWSLSYEDLNNGGYERASEPVPLKLLVEPNELRIEYIGYKAESEYAHLTNNNGERGYYFFTNIVALLRENFENNV